MGNESKLSSADLGLPGFVELSAATHLEEYIVALEQTVFGQRRAVTEVARSLLRAKAGLANPDRPLGVFLFLGPPGCGKTEMGRAIARILNPSDPKSRLLIVDCGQFQEDHEISRLTGSPPGYVGYKDEPMISRQFLTRGPVVIVFDEIERAHRALSELLLGVFDRAQLPVPDTTSDNAACLLNLNQTIIIMTSNLGTSEIQQAKAGQRMGFIKEIVSTNEELTRIGLVAAEQHWRDMPAFLNRLDAQVVFDPLTLEFYAQIFDKFLREINAHQTNQNNPLTVTIELKDWILANFDLSGGGRGLRRAMEEYLVTPAATIKLQLPPDVPFIATLKDGKVVFYAAQELLDQVNSKLTTVWWPATKPDQLPVKRRSKRRRSRRY